MLQYCPVGGSWCGRKLEQFPTNLEVIENTVVLRTYPQYRCLWPRRLSGRRRQGRTIAKPCSKRRCSEKETRKTGYSSNIETTAGAFSVRLQAFMHTLPSNLFEMRRFSPLHQEGAAAAPVFRGHKCCAALRTEQLLALAAYVCCPSSLFRTAALQEGSKTFHQGIYVCMIRVSSNSTGPRKRYSTVFDVKNGDHGAMLAANLGDRWVHFKLFAAAHPVLF